MNFLPNQIFTSIRIVNTKELWQDNENGWAQIAVYDESNGQLIGKGWDIVSFSGKPFSVEAKMNKEGLVYYGGKFQFPSTTYHNELSITVI